MAVLDALGHPPQFLLGHLEALGITTPGLLDRALRFTPTLLTVMGFDHQGEDSGVRPGRSAPAETAPRNFWLLTSCRYRR